MKKRIISALIFVSVLCVGLAVGAKEREVFCPDKMTIVSEGLYFSIKEIVKSPNLLAVTVSAKSNSFLSQAIYVDLSDESNNFYSVKESNLELFRPLKLNKTVTQKLTFEVPTTSKSYKLNVYSKDIFKKNKKQLISKLSVK